MQNEMHVSPNVNRPCMQLNGWIAFIDLAAARNSRPDGSHYNRRYRWMGYWSHMEGPDLRAYEGPTKTVALLPSQFKVQILII